MALNFPGGLQPSQDYVDTKSIVFKPYIFPENIPRSTALQDLPRPQERIERTSQLIWCITLAHRCNSLEESTPNNAEQAEYLTQLDKNPIERDKLYWLAARMVEEFVLDVNKSSDKIAEIIALGPILQREQYRKLLSSFIATLDNARMLDINILQGLVQLIQSNSPGYLVPDDLINILRILRIRLDELMQNSNEYSFYLTLAVSRILDIMADHEVKDLDRVLDQEPLSGILAGLKDSSEPYLMYQACYAFQALQFVPDNETPLQAALRYSTGVFDGLVKASAVMTLDVGSIIEGLGNLQNTLMDSIKTGMTIYEGANSLVESGRGIIGSLKEQYGSGAKRPWYVAVRAANALKETGQLKDLNQLICDAPCRRDPLFQWGICQVLGEIASDFRWDTTVRQQAITLLGELYKNDPEWSQDGNVKNWMINILRYLSSNIDQAINTCAHNLLKVLIHNQDSAFSNPFLPKYQIPLPSSSPLLIKVQNIPYVENTIHQLKINRLKEYRKGVYIQPQARPSLQATDDTFFPLLEKVKEFLDGHQQVFLILGDSGAGKSTFNRELEHMLWQNYKSYGPIPLFINLPTMEDPARNLIEKQLQEYNFSEDKIREMKNHREFILICDGYDESQQKINIHTTNQFNQPGQWKVRMIISCRSQYLGQDYRSRFQPQPTDVYQRTTVDLFQEAVIASFSRAQIRQYIEEYVKEQQSDSTFSSEPKWTVDEYMNTLMAIPSLMDLVSNPFLLSLSLVALPSVIIASDLDLSSIRITRVQLYDSFVKRWLKVNQKRLEESPLSDSERSELETLIEDNFFHHSIQFQRDLSSALFLENLGNPVVKYTHLRDKNTWKAAFFDPEGQAKLLRESSLVTRSGVFFRFLHRSFLEYFYSRTIYDPRDDNDSPDSQESAPEFKSSLSRMSIIREPSILQFLAERAQQNIPFQQQLLEIIEESKIKPVIETTQVAAANAITILVKAGFAFHGADLRGINIPGADLSNGQFDFCNFQTANLTGVNLSRTWMRNADFCGSVMDNVQFGELPCLEYGDCLVSSCTYSPDGKSFAVGTWTGIIDIYDTTTWLRKYQICGHTKNINGCSFSRNSELLVSASLDGTIRVWETTKGEAVAVMKGHTKSVMNVSFSPCGKQVASSGFDKTVRLWIARTGECQFVLEGHGDLVRTISYSPDGTRITSCSDDGTVRSWDPFTGCAVGPVWESSHGKTLCLAYSPDGQKLAVGHSFGHLLILDTLTGEPSDILYGHNQDVISVMFSASGQWLVTASNDRTVRLWDTLTGTLVSTLTGHSGCVFQAVVSPDEHQIASIGADKKVRFWVINSEGPEKLSNFGASRPQDQRVGVLALAYAHADGGIISVDDDLIVRRWDPQSMTGGGMYEADIYAEAGDDIDEDMFFLHCAVFSPNGRQVATSFDEGPIRIASFEPGSGPGDGKVLKGHLRAVNAIAFSPCGQWIISAGFDKSVRLWNLEQSGQNQVLVQLDDDNPEESDIGCVAFSPIGNQVAAGFSDGTVSLFDPLSFGPIETGKKVLNGQSIITLKYSPCGKQLSLGTSSGVIYLCRTPQLDDPGIILYGHSKEVTCLAYSPCGNWIASGSNDETVRLWYQQVSGREGKKTWSCVSVVYGFFKAISDIVWDIVVPMEFATSCKDGSVRVWRVSLLPVHSDKEEEKGKQEGEVRFVWGSNLGILCAANMRLDAVQGLTSIQQRLLSQRGAEVRE